MMKKSAILLTLLTSSVFASSFAFAAEENVASFDLDQIVVTSTLKPVTVFDAHANVNVVTATEIENKHYTQVTDALRQVPGVVITDYGRVGYEGSNTIRINGTEKTVVLVDGVRVNTTNINAFLAANLIPVENIERIEVMKGAGSALYGADAKGGVINIITKKVQDKRTTLSLAVGNFGEEEYKIYHQGRDKKISYRVNAKKHNLGDFDDGDGNKVERSLRGETYGFQIRDEFSEGTDLTLSFDKSSNDFTYRDSFYGSGVVDGKNKSEQWTISSNQKFNENTTNNITFKRTKYDFSYKSVKDWTTSMWGSNAVDYENEVTGWSFRDQFTTKIGDKNTFVAGLEYNNDKVNYSTSGTVLNKKVITKALLLQDTFQITDKWDLTAGVRFDDHSIAGNSTTPRYNLGYKADENNSMYVSYSRFFIAPGYYEYFGPYTYSKLNPEKGYTWEFGWNHKFDKDTETAIHLFKRKSHDAVAYDYNAWAYTNCEKEEAQGFDVQFNKRIKDLTFKLGYTYTQTEQESNGSKSYNVRGYLPKHTVNIGVGYAVEKFAADLDVRGALNRKGVAGSAEFEDDNYWLVNLSLNYKPIKNTKVFLKVNNLLDKNYSEYTAAPYYGYYNMPGRNFLVGMEYSF
ncbi:MAG: TonB-dependent receptor [Phascolarctobacterium sp.]|nr:TonB-dependent receptor [Phascolarctobacterium sp.]